MQTHENIESPSLRESDSPSPRTFPLPGSQYYRMLHDPKPKSSIKVQVGFDRFHACAELVEDREELHEMMKWLVKHYVRSSEGKAMGWDPCRDDPETADFSEMFEHMAIVRLSERL